MNYSQKQSNTTRREYGRDEHATNEAQLWSNHGVRGDGYGYLALGTGRSGWLGRVLRRFQWGSRGGTWIQSSPNRVQSIHGRSMASSMSNRKIRWLGINGSRGTVVDPPCPFIIDRLTDLTAWASSMPARLVHIGLAPYLYFVYPTSCFTFKSSLENVCILRIPN